MRGNTGQPVIITVTTLTSTTLSLSSSLPSSGGLSSEVLVPGQCWSSLVCGGSTQLQSSSL